MVYRVVISDTAKKCLEKIDKHQASLILAWLKKNVDGCENPRLHGKPLSYDRKGEWRYRLGNYRILAAIEDSTVLVEIINVGHRKNIYKK